MMICITGVMNNSLSDVNHEWIYNYNFLASLVFSLLLLLIVKYEGVGTYDKMIIMDWYVSQ